MPLAFGLKWSQNPQKQVQECSFHSPVGNAFLSPLDPPTSPLMQAAFEETTKLSSWLVKYCLLCSQSKKLFFLFPFSGLFSLKLGWLCCATGLLSESWGGSLLSCFSKLNGSAILQVEASKLFRGIISGGNLMFIEVWGRNTSKRWI